MSSRNQALGEPLVEPDLRVGRCNPATVKIPVGGSALWGELVIPVGAGGIVLFAHGSGSSRFSPRNRFVARSLHNSGLATLLFDLLTPDEQALELRTKGFCIEVGLLSSRLVDATRWIAKQDWGHRLGLGYFGSSTGAAAALLAAATIGSAIDAVVSRGGRLNLAGTALSRVDAATLLIVGEYDDQIIALNELAYTALQCEKELVVVSGATHLFEEPGALEEVSRNAVNWFQKYLRPR